MKISLFSLLFFVYCLTLVKTQAAEKCLQLGFQNCLDMLGQCTIDFSNCAKPCQKKNDCQFCCFNGFCLSQSQCESIDNANIDNLSKNESSSSKDKSQLLKIIIPIAIVSCLAAPFVCLCIYMLKRLQSMDTIKYDRTDFSLHDLPLDPIKQTNHMYEWQVTEQQQQQEQYNSLYQNNSQQFLNKNTQLIKDFHLNPSQNSITPQIDYEKQATDNLIQAN